MDLNQFLSGFRITPESLSKIKNRVFVVGKFNTSNAGAQEYLFTRKNINDPRFSKIVESANGRETISTIGGLEYADFIKLIEPKLSEKREYKEDYNGEKIPYFILSPKLSGADDGVAYVLDNYNYFDVRGSSNSDQPYYQENKPSLNIKDFLSYQIDANSPFPGKEIYRQIRSNLKSFCDFQSKNHELIKVFAKLLANYAGKDGIPPGLGKNAELPVNFLSVFIDYLYYEKPIDEEFDKKLALVDFSSVPGWKDALTNDASKAKLLSYIKNLLGYFKYYLTKPADFNKHVAFPGIKEILNEKEISPSLQKQFVASMEAYNMLMQIIQSKVLLSMVLRWAISYFENDIKEIKKEPNDDIKFKMIERAILHGEHGIKKPAAGNLPQGYSINQLIEDFKRYFRDICDYVFNSGLEVNIKKYEAFPEVIKSVADDILNTKDKRETINRMMGLGYEQKEAMVKALQNIFVDIIIPKIFKTPGLSYDELINKYKEYETDLFFTEAMLKIADDDKLDKIIEKAVQDQPDRPNTIGNQMATLIDVTFGVLMAPQVQNNVKNISMTLTNVRLIGGATDSIINKKSPSLLGIGGITTKISKDNKFQPGETNAMAAEKKRIGAGLDLKGIEHHANVQDWLLEAEKEQKLIADRTEKPIDAKKDTEPASLTESAVIVQDKKGLAVTQYDANEKNQPLIKFDQVPELHEIEVPNLALAIKQLVSATAEEKDMQIQRVNAIVENTISVYQKNLASIFDRFAGIGKLPSFKNKVEAFTLTWLLLLSKDKLELGEAGSNLYELLIDLVEKLDSNEPNLQSFFRENSLTKYINKNHFTDKAIDGAGDGFRAIRNILEEQSRQSLKNVVQFVSELKGIRYLIDEMNKGEDDAELIVINAYHYEFIDWLKNPPANYTGHLLDATGLANNNERNPKFASTIFMTDLSFANDGWDNIVYNKTVFLTSLGDNNLLNNNGNNRVLPPICIATSAIRPNARDYWHIEGNTFEQLAQKSISPVVILGPSIPLNKPDDYLFPTVLASGYIFCSHLISKGRPQQLKIFDEIANISKKRFRVLQYGTAKLHESIDYIINAQGAGNEDYAYIADFYMYIILLLASAAKNNIILYNQFSWEQFYSIFYNNQGFGSQNYNSSVTLNNSLISNIYSMDKISISQSLYNFAGRVPNNQNNNGNNSIVDPDDIYALSLKIDNRTKQIVQGQWFQRVITLLNLY